MIAVCRLRFCERTRAYAQRRTAEGKTKPEIIRCLKRYIAREIYHALRADLAELTTPNPATPSPPGTPAHGNRDQLWRWPDRTLPTTHLTSIGTSRGGSGRHGDDGKVESRALLGQSEELNVADPWAAAGCDDDRLLVRRHRRTIVPQPPIRRRV
ncbi:MAG TPA: hypothetical protein VFZ00_20060 [Solirubrobacter sp.]|jgi:hypothetical protein|nr:hypothetical protein [Solirubrobacter sp.]